MFHTVRPRNKNDIKLKNCYKSCLQNVLTYGVKSIAFSCVATGICGFDQRKVAEIALATDRLWLESNHSSVDRVISCTHENADYEISKDLMSTVYFPVSKIHLTDNYMKESSNNDFVENMKNFEISDELGQNLSGWQIYPSTESPKESSKTISDKVDFNVARDPNIPLGLANFGENTETMEKNCFFNSVIQVLYCLPLFRDYMKTLGPSVKGVAMKIRKLFKEIEISNQPVRTSNYVRYLSLQGYEPGIQYDAHECLLQLLAKIYPSINDDCMFKIHVLNTSTKTVYVTQLFDALIIQLNIFKYSGGISKKVVSNLIIDEEISLWGNRMICLVLFIMRENSLIVGIIHQELK